jgi:hypothetical protein
MKTYTHDEYLELLRKRLKFAEDDIAMVERMFTDPKIKVQMVNFFSRQKVTIENEIKRIGNLPYRIEAIE